MAGGAFVLLKAGRAGAESANQAEIRLANLLKILAIAYRRSENAGSARRHSQVAFAVVQGMANSC